MRYFAIALGVSLSSVAALDVAAADRGTFVEQSSSRWNSFRRPSVPLRSVGDAANPLSFGATVQSAAAQNQVESLPPPDVGLAEPVAELAPPPQQAPVPEQAIELPAHAPASGCGSPYQAAAECSWEGHGCGGSCASASTPKPIAPWFGGASLLFWDVANSNDTPLVTYDNGVVVMRNSDLDPSGDVGFDVHLGRYFGCGQYAIDVGYMLWDPECLCRQVPDGGAGLRFINPALTTASINRGGGATTVYDDYDTNATGIQVIRDLRVQSLEVNLIGFGLMGARRLGSCGPAPICGGACGVLGCKGKSCGSAIGPLARSASGRLRIQNSHGFRWFQLRDDLEIGGNVDGNAGYGTEDLYYKSEVENNLFGYQFGSRLSYCMGNRMMINLGGKIGVYGNDAQFFHSISTTTVAAYTNSQGAGAGDLFTEQSDVSLAGLGELDLGLGYRISNCWTINGGYRVLAACGVATSLGQMPTEYTTAASAGAVRADDSLVLHGAYLGLDYNW